MRELDNCQYCIEDGYFLVRYRHSNFGLFDKIGYRVKLEFLDQQDLDYIVNKVYRAAQAEQTQQLRKIFGL